MPINKISVYDSIKFLWAVTIIMAGLLIRTEKIGETEENIFFQDYLKQQEDSQNEETSILIHSAPTEIKDICEPQDLLCNKIRSPWTSEIIPYKNEIHTISYFINSNQTLEKKLVDTIKKIEIKNDKTAKRGYATRYEVVVNAGPVESIKEFQNLTTHELGHIFDLGVMQGNKNTKSSSFTEFNKVVFSSNDPSLLFYKLSRESEKIRKKGSNKKDFCSGYGMSNPFEDFSECFNLYINNQYFFKTIARQSSVLEKKYNFIASILQGKYKEKNSEALWQLKNNRDRRPRDSTKL
jgi:hypothetical protein